MILEIYVIDLGHRARAHAYVCVCVRVCACVHAQLALDRKAIHLSKTLYLNPFYNI